MHSSSVHSALSSNNNNDEFILPVQNHISHTWDVPFQHEICTVTTWKGYIEYICMSGDPTRMMMMSASIAISSSRRYVWHRVAWIASFIAHMQTLWPIRTSVCYMQTCCYSILQWLCVYGICNYYITRCRRMPKPIHPTAFVAGAEQTL